MISDKRFRLSCILNVRPFRACVVWDMMVSGVDSQVGSRGRGGAVLHPPVPREHGAWAIVYAPVLIGASASPQFRWWAAALLLLGITGLYLARNAASLAIRRRDRAMLAWAAAYGTCGAAGILPLLAATHRLDLLQVGAIAAILFAAHAALSAVRGPVRFDRTMGGELLGVCGLTLTGPAAYIAGGGHPGPDAWRLWALCALFFGSGVVYVKTAMAAASAARAAGIATALPLPLPMRILVGRAHIAYHMCMAVSMYLGARALGGVPGAMVAVAFIPALVRAASGWAGLQAGMPRFREVGRRETVLAVWFTLFASLALAGRV